MWMWMWMWMWTWISNTHQFFGVDVMSEMGTEIEFSNDEWIRKSASRALFVGWNITARFIFNDNIIDNYQVGSGLLSTNHGCQHTLVFDWCNGRCHFRLLWSISSQKHTHKIIWNEAPTTEFNARVVPTRTQTQTHIHTHTHTNPTKKKASYGSSFGSTTVVSQRKHNKKTNNCKISQTTAEASCW